MTEKTEKIIIDNALRIFASKGYYGATTRLIANESGFSEVTLFRKFKNKENLFKVILTRNQEKILMDLNSILNINQYQDSKDFLKILVNGIVSMVQENFDFIKIIQDEKCEISENALKVLVDHLGKYMEENFPNNKTDYTIFAFTIWAFAYFLIFDKIHGRTFIDHNNAVDEFINQSAILLG